LAPLRRALLNPMAIACLRFFTGCFPERIWCISVRTSCCALRPYLRPREEERWEREARDERLGGDVRDDRRLDLDGERCDRDLELLALLAILTSPYQTQAVVSGLAETDGGCSLRINKDGDESKSRATLTDTCRRAWSMGFQDKGRPFSLLKKPAGQFEKTSREAVIWNWRTSASYMCTITGPTAK
jgi:hypothetical protein